MKTNPANESSIKTPEAMTDDDIINALTKLMCGYRGRQRVFEVCSGSSCELIVLHEPEGWTDWAGQWHEQVPEFLHSLDALVPVTRRLSFDQQLALHRRVTLNTRPRVICLEILQVTGFFGP